VKTEANFQAVRFGVVRAARMTMLLWELCVGRYQRFGQRYCFCLQALKVERVCFFETLTSTCKSTQRQYPFEQHCRCSSFLRGEEFIDSPAEWQLLKTALLHDVNYFIILVKEYKLWNLLYYHVLLNLRGLYILLNKTPFSPSDPFNICFPHIWVWETLTETEFCIIGFTYFKL
jgi:hypothetical protein